MRIRVRACRMMRAYVKVPKFGCRASSERNGLPDQWAVNGSVGIMQVMMRDPVVTSDGESYERTAITAWLARHGAVSPCTGCHLPSAEILSTHSLRCQADRYVNMPAS